MTSSRVRAVQERRRSNAAGPHGSRVEREDEPCLCGTGFTCLARVHEEEDADPSSDLGGGQLVRALSRRLRATLREELH